MNCIIGFIGKYYSLKPYNKYFKLKLFWCNSKICKCICFIRNNFRNGNIYYFRYRVSNSKLALLYVLVCKGYAWHITFWPRKTCFCESKQSLRGDSDIRKLDSLKKHGEIVRSSIWWYFYQFDCGITWWNSTFRENQIDSKLLKSTQIDSNRLRLIQIY